MIVNTLFKVAEQILIERKITEIKKHIKQHNWPYELFCTKPNRTYQTLRIRNKNNNNTAEFNLLPNKQIICVFLSMGKIALMDRKSIDLMRKKKF